MKSLKNLFILGVCTTLIAGSNSPVFAGEVEPSSTESTQVFTSTDGENALLDLTQKYHELVLKNADLHNEKSELKCQNIELQEKNSKLESENEKLKQDYEKCKKRMLRYKKKLEKKQSCVTKEEMQSEVQSTKSRMILEFTKFLGEYIKNNPNKKMKYVNLTGLFKDFLTLNVNYVNNGDTNISPVALKGKAEANFTGAGVTL